MNTKAFFSGVFIFTSLATASLATVGCDNDPAEGKTKVEAAAPVEEKVQEVKKKSTTFKLSDKDGSVGFVGAKVTDKHEGGFERFTGTIDYVDHDIEKSSVEVEIDINSLSIEPAKLKGHLLSPDFFVPEKFPHAKFKSTKIVKKAGEGSSHEITGNLELRGEKKSITFPATIKASGEGVDVEAEFAINRKDFGIVYPGMPDDLIKDDVLIKLSLHAKNKS